MLGGVDLMTHAALGAAIGEMILGRRMGNHALVWGSLFGILPDLDVVVSPFLSVSADLWWHRGPSHSLLVMTLLSWWLAPRLSKLWKRDKISRARAGWFVLAVWSGHALLDCLTVHGTSVWWPFPANRVALNTLSGVDPLFTLPLVVSLVWLAFLRTKKQLPKRRKLNLAGLGLAAGYVLLAAGLKQMAAAGFEADLARRGTAIERRMEAPTPFNILLWRSVVDRGNEFWVGYRSVFDGPAAPVRWTIYPRHAEALARVEESRGVRRLKWFADGWWIARQHVKGAWVGDIRFCERRRWGARKGMVDSRLAVAWDVLRDENGERLRAKFPKSGNTAESLRRIGLRITGDRGVWEANPRLAGVTGSLPEFLAVEE